MSYDLSAQQVTQFESEVHHEFRTVADSFEDLARVRRVTGAGKVSFPIFGYNKMNPHQAGQLIAPAQGARTKVELTLTSWALGDWTDIFMGSEVNFDEKNEFIKVIADAFKNASAQRIIDALAASGTTKTVATTISGAADDMTVDAVIESARLLDKDGVPNDGKRILMLSASGVHNLLKDPRVTSMDFVQKQALMSGKLDNFYGYKVRMFGDMAEGGLPKASTTRKSYAYHQSAVGYGANVTQKIDVQYYNTHGAHFVSGLQSCAAKVLDAKGVVEISTIEAA